MRTRMKWSGAVARWAGAIVAAGLLVACSVDGTGAPEARGDCALPGAGLADGGVGRDGIPALTDPALVDAGETQANYLLDADRVVGIRLDQAWVAVPHNILWWHEIVNFTNEAGGRVSVTYCPLTGSSLAFDLGTIEVSRFIVSGLLFQNNLVMLDPDTESLWPQMSLRAECGPRNGTELSILPSIEMTWRAWRELHPDTKVVSGATGFSRDYTRYPYGNYEEPNEPPLFPQGPLDGRRPVKERVLGVPAGFGGVGFPFFALAEEGTLAVAHASLPRDGGEVVVLWDGTAEAAAAYRPVADGRPLTLAVQEGRIVDAETGSAWRVDGAAVEGPLAGSRLEPVPEAHVAFWFAWAAFHPQTTIWTPDS